MPIPPRSGFYLRMLAFCEFSFGPDYANLSGGRGLDFIYTFFSGSRGLDFIYTRFSDFIEASREKKEYRFLFFLHYLLGALLRKLFSSNFQSGKSRRAAEARGPRSC